MHTAKGKYGRTRAYTIILYSVVIGIVCIKIRWNLFLAGIENKIEILYVMSLGTCVHDLIRSDYRTCLS